MLKFYLTKKVWYDSKNANALEGSVVRNTVYGTRAVMDGIILRSHLNSYVPPEWHIMKANN